MNRRRERTEQYKKAVSDFRLTEYAKNGIEAHNFNRLIRAGVVVQEPIKMIMHTASEASND